MRAALTVYSYAALGDTESTDHLRSVWESCGRLKLTEPIPELGLGTAFPSLDRDPGTWGFRLRAAKRRRATHGIHEALLFTSDDVLGIIVSLNPNRERESADCWQTLHDAWSEASGDGSPVGHLCEALVFSALCKVEPAELERALGPSPERLVPAARSDGSWWESGSLLEQGFFLVEAPSADQRRRMVVLAPQEKETELERWISWWGAHSLTPFARCLLHAAKIRFEGGVWESKRRQLKEKEEELESALDDVFHIRDRATTTELVEAQAHLAEVEADSTGVVALASDLRRLQRTIRIATANLSRWAPEPQASIFGADIAHGDWIVQQIDHDVGYAEEKLTRAHSATAFTRFQVDKATEQRARHEYNLQLLQTSLVSALLVLIAASEVLSLTIPAPTPLAVPLLLLAGALALALPLVVMRWREDYHRFDRLASGFAGLCLGWSAGAVIHWAATGFETRPATLVPLVLLTVLLAYCGAVVANALTFLIDKAQTSGWAAVRKEIGPRWWLRTLAPWK